MPLNTLEFATKFAGELDKLVTQKAVTGFMADNVLRAKFVGAKTVIIPDIDFVGLADYDRDNGFSKGKMTIAQTSFELTQDRARSLQIDREDMDETGIANLAGQVMGEFVRTKVVPEVDSYVLSTLAKLVAANKYRVSIDKEIDKTNNSIILNPENTYAQFVTLTNMVSDKAGFDTELVAFVNPTVYAAFMNSNEIQRHITVSDFKQGEVNLKVKKLNDVTIIPVSSERMKSEYVKNEETGILEVSETAKDIGIIVLPKKAASLVKKSEKIRVFEPDTNQDADAYKFDYRIYYDVFVKKSNMEHIAAAIME